MNRRILVFAIVPLLVAAGSAVASPDADAARTRRFWTKIRDAQSDLATVRAHCQVQMSFSALGIRRIDEGTVCWMRKPDGAILQRWDLEGTGPDGVATKTTYLATDAEIVTLTDGAMTDRGPLWSPEILNFPALGGPVLSISRERELDLVVDADGYGEVSSEHKDEPKKEANKTESDPPSEDTPDALDRAPGVEAEEAGSPPRPSPSPEDQTLPVSLSPRNGPWKDLLAKVFVDFDMKLRLIQETRFLETGNNLYIVLFTRFEVNPPLDENLFKLPEEPSTDPDRR